MGFKDKLLITLKKIGEKIDELTEVMKRHDEKMDVHYKMTETLKAQVEEQETKTNALIEAATENNDNERAEEVCAKVNEISGIVTRLNDEVTALALKANDRTALEECAARNEALAEKVANLEGLTERVAKLEEKPAAAPAATVAEAKPAPAYGAEIAELNKRIKALENRKPMPRQPRLLWIYRALKTASPKLKKP